jgi:hypothetical protein
VGGWRLSKHEGVDGILLVVAVTKVEGWKGRWRGNCLRRGNELDLFNLLDLFHFFRGSKDDTDTPYLPKHVLVLLDIRQGVFLPLPLFFGEDTQGPLVLDFVNRDRGFNDSTNAARDVERCVALVGKLESAGEDVLTLLIVERHGCDRSGVITAVRLV